MKPGIALFALAACCMVSRPAAASVDQGLLALVPDSTVTLAGVDAEAMRNSDFGQYLLRRMDSEDEHMQKFVADTGFEPRRDLQDLLIASFSPQRGTDHSRFVILARGTFDPHRIATAAKTNNSFVKEQYAGTDLFVQHERAGDNAFAFPDTGVALFGDIATVKAILDQRGNPTSLDPGLLERANKTGSSNDFWYASIVSGSYLGNHLSLPPSTGGQLKDSSALQSIVQSAGGVRFGDQVQLSFDATTRSPQDAASLADVIRAVSSMVQLGRQSGADGAVLANALDQMQLRTSGSELHIGLSMSEKNLELLAAQSDSKHGQ